MTRLRLTFLTPLFSKGSYEDRPEVRAPSIRGQLHWWFRALGGSPADENAIFGSVHTKPVNASRIVVRAGNVTGKEGAPATLPHKRGGQASEKAAYLPGTNFELHLLERLGGLSDSQRRAFQRALEAWLLLGTLGLRATRAAGSFTWEVLDPGPLTLKNPPATLADYQALCETVLTGAPLRLILLPEAYPCAEAARVIVSDTIGGPGGASDWEKLHQVHWPLGNVKAGQQKQVVPDAPQRKTSPLRFRILRLETGHHIAAIWDNRSTVTGNQPGDFEGIIRLLADRKKAIGVALLNKSSHP